MDAPRTPLSRRARRILSSVLAGLLALGGGTALVVAGAVGAVQADPGDVYFLTPEGVGITTTSYNFTGMASPGDAVTLTSAASDPCHAIADETGFWQCDVAITASTVGTAMLVKRDVDDNNPYTYEDELQEFSVGLPPIVNTGSSGGIRTNDPDAPITGYNAAPGANLEVYFGEVECTGAPADEDGGWSCVPPDFGDGTYNVSVSQIAGSAHSDPFVVTYTIDRTTPLPQISQPYDGSEGPLNIQTSRRQPLFTGQAEPGATVHLLATDYGTTPITHPSETPAFDLYCEDVTNGDGNWSCTGAPMTIGHFWKISVWSTDDLGNTSPSPDDEFGIEILPPPDAPQVIYPTPGAGELFPMQVWGTVDDVTTSVRISEGEGDLCGVIIPTTGGDFSCPAIAASPGNHTIDILAFDQYGTSTTTSVNVRSWAQPTISYPGVEEETSRSTIHVTGTAEPGSDLSVRVDESTFNGCSILPEGPTYDCQTGFLSVGGHLIEVDFTDPWGTSSETISRFISIVPPLPAPVFTAPSVGYSSKDRSIQVGMTLSPQGTVYVREGINNLCAPKPVESSTYSCTTSNLSVGTHTITISQTDQYGVMSASAQRKVTIVPTPALPLTMKTFEFAFTVLNEKGEPIGDDGIGTGDMITIVASGVPPGTIVQTEIHSDPVALGGMTVGPSGLFKLSTIVPAVPPGDHEVVVAASGPGYWPGTFTAPLAVHGLKQIPEAVEEPVIIKELGEPSEEPVDTDETSGTGVAGGGPGGSGANGFEDPSVFGSSLASPYDTSAHAFALSPAGIVLSGSIAIAFLLLVGFPAELLESTIRSNYDRAFGGLARLRQRVAKRFAAIARALANPWVGSGLTILAAAFLLGFADPNYGFNGASVRLFIAMIAAVLAINVGLMLIVSRVASRAFDVAAVLKPMPAALLIVGISVLVSRLAGISPGFLFGIVLGIAYARELRLRDEARLGLLGVGLTIAAGLIAWLGYGLATAIASGPGFFNNLIIEVLAAITLEALGTLVIALLPIEFLDGRTIWRWSKLAWIAAYGVTLLVFVFVVIPLSDNWGTMSAPIFGWGTLFVVFAVVAVITWAIFRRRPRAKTSTPEGAPPRQRLRR
jgi:hypothetical protein